VCVCVGGCARRHTYPGKLLPSPVADISISNCVRPFPALPFFASAAFLRCAWRARWPRRLRRAAASPPMLVRKASGEEHGRAERGNPVELCTEAQGYGFREFPASCQGSFPPVAVLSAPPLSLSQGHGLLLRAVCRSFHLEFCDGVSAWLALLSAGYRHPLLPQHAGHRSTKIVARSPHVLPSPLRSRPLRPSPRITRLRAGCSFIGI